MASLLHLCNEILLQIIEETRPDSISNFVRSCKTLWVLGAHALEQHKYDLDFYSAPKFGVWRDQPEYDLNSYKYLSAILLKPRRALYVKHLFALNSGFTLTQSQKAPFPSQTLSMIARCCHVFFETAGCPYIEKDEFCEWMEKLRNGDTNAVVCLVLTLLSNLQKLSISNYSDNGYAEMIYQISKANQSPNRTIPGPLPLNKLHTIVINDISISNQPMERFGIYETCLTLPSLRKLQGRCIDFEFDRWPPEDEFPHESMVTDIIFNSSNISAESFERLFERTRRLQRFTYEFVRPRVLDWDHTAMGLKKILEKHTANTLVYLDVTFEGWPFTSQRGFIGSLQKFQVLKYISVSANMFIDYAKSRGEIPQLVDFLPFLPASIETLTLRPLLEHTPVTYTLNELRYKREEWLPNLKRVICGANNTMANGLKDECASVGIDLVYG